MKASLCAPLFLLVGACAAPGRPQSGPGTAPVGAPDSPVSAAALDAALPAEHRAAPEAIRLPDRITLPAAYRLLLVDGHLTLVRESDEQAFEKGPVSMRIIAGEIARGELAYQPGLPPQELAQEVAAERESSARMDGALGAVMQRSRELSERAMELEAQGKRLAELLAASQALVRQLETQGKPAPARAAPQADSPNEPQQ